MIIVLWWWFYSGFMVSKESHVSFVLYQHNGEHGYIFKVNQVGLNTWLWQLLWKRRDIKLMGLPVQHLAVKTHFIAVHQYHSSDFQALRIQKGETKKIFFGIFFDILKFCLVHIEINFWQRQSMHIPKTVIFFYIGVKNGA